MTERRLDREDLVNLLSFEGCKSLLDREDHDPSSYEQDRVWIQILKRAAKAAKTLEDLMYISSKITKHYKSRGIYNTLSMQKLEIKTREKVEKKIKDIKGYSGILQGVQPEDCGWIFKRIEERLQAN